MKSKSVYGLPTMDFSSQYLPKRGLSYHQCFQFLWLVFATQLISCNQRDEVISERFFTFGTIVDITICGKSQAEVNHVLDVLQGDFENLNSALNPWKSGILAHANGLLERGEKFSVDPFLLPLFIQTQELSLRSEGMFNPAIGKLIKLWGFDEEPVGTPEPPEKKEISKLLQSSPKMEDIEINGNVVFTQNKAVQLDFGAFAKGYAVDLAIKKLKSMGIQNAIVNAGGDLRAIGKRGSRAWHIGIRHPRGNHILAAINTNDDESVFTSGDYERFYVHNGRRYHHILDPTSGYPVQHTVSATVIHPVAAVADAASTALFIAGPERWHSIARNLGISYVMLVDAQGTIHMNPKMAQRIEFNVSPIPKIIISDPL